MLRLSKSWSIVICCSLFCLLSACGATPSSQTSIHADSNQMISGAKSTPTTVSMPPTQTSCPASNTARALVTAPLALGKDPTIVYTVNQSDSKNNPTMGTLKRYDVTTGSKTVVASIPNVSIDYAQISTDGQWILFASYSKVIGAGSQGPEREAMLQAVRMDGQGLQTLYCATASYSDFTNIQWSPDQKSIAIFRDALDNATPNPNETRTVQILNTATGQLQNVFASTPSVRASIGLGSWADNTHLYMFGEEEDSEQNIYLLDTTKGINQHGSDLTTILSGPFMSFSANGTKVYIDYNGCDYQEASCSPPSKVIAMSDTGGVSQTIWQSTQYNVTQACPLNNHQMLIVIENFQQSPGPTDASHNGLWIMNGDGTLARRIFSNAPNDSLIAPVGDCSSIWSHASRDGNMYAVMVNVQLASSSQHQIQLVFGKISGGTSTLAATFGDGLSGTVVGWTTM